MTTTKNASGRPKPKLPVEQLAILAAVRFAEPVAYTSVFPYLPEMIRDFGVEQNDIARWAGLTSAVFSMAQSITAVPWGRAADRYGRKPTLILGMVSTMICFVAWGMSTSLPMAITVRAIQGGGNGNVGIIRTMVAEMVPQKELQPRAFSIMPLVWSIGSVVGPSFGGFFAQPAKQYPSLFGHMAFFRRFPYALPNLVACIFFVVSLVIAALFLHETLAAKKGEHDWGLLVGKRLSRAFRRRPAGPENRLRRSFVDGEATAPLVPSKAVVSGSGSGSGNHNDSGGGGIDDNGKKQHRHVAKPPSLRDVLTRQTVINLASYTFLAFHSVAYDQNVTVLLNHPRESNAFAGFRFPFYFNGGFGLKSGEIGTIFTLYGIACGLIQFLVYPRLVSAYGVLHCFRICSLILPISYFLTPYTALFEDSTTRFVALAIVMLVKGFGIIIAFPSTTILLTNSCTSVRVLGTLNGFATSLSGLGRAFGPLLTGMAFTWGANHGYIVAPYAFLTLIAALGAIPVFMIIEGDGLASESSDEGEDETESDDEYAVIDEADGDECEPLLSGPTTSYAATATATSKR